MENIKNYLIKKIKILSKFSSIPISLKLEKIEEEIKSSLLKHQIHFINDKLEAIELELKAELSTADYRELKRKLVLLDEQNESVLKEFKHIYSDYERIRKMVTHMALNDDNENYYLKEKIINLENRVVRLNRNMERLIEAPQTDQREAELKISEIDKKFSQLLKLNDKNSSISEKINKVLALEDKLEKLEADAQSMLNNISTVQLAKHYLEAKNKYGAHYHKYPECNWWNIIGFFKYIITNLFQIDFFFYMMFLTSLFSFAFIYWQFVSGNTLNYKYLPLSLPFIWCAWHFQRKINTREKLYELYNHKQRVMETYVAFKNGTYTLAADDKMEQVLLDAVKKDPSGYIGKNNDTIIESVLDRINGKIVLSKVKNRLEEESLDD